MKKTPISAGLRRLGALSLAAGTLWAVSVTAGSETAASAATALRAATPLGALRWELGDLWPADTLSPAAALTIGQSPLLLSARTAMAELWSSERTEEPPPGKQEENIVTVPVEETPLDTALPPDTPATPDNGVAARTLVPTSSDGYTVCGRTYISNATPYALSPEELSKPFDAALGEEGPQVLILHTHGSEAYTPPPGTDIVWSGDRRTTDSRYNVVRVGDEMADVFSTAGVSVLHDRTLYDYPSYSGAYDRSLAAIQSYLAQYPSIRFILDVHRDAITDQQGNDYKVVSSPGKQGTPAQLTLVMGSSGSGLTHDRWRENLKLAVAVQNQALKDDPTLMRPLLLRNSRYNQHAATGSLLLEVGAAGNSPEEAVLAGKIFAEELLTVLGK